MLSYNKIFEDTMKKITETQLEWEKFLRFSGQLFKYDLFNKVLIYGQRPDATMVADMNTWNNRVGRWINRGSKAIKVISEDNKNIRYLFDISDTHGEPTTRITNYTIKSEEAQKFIINYIGGSEKKDFRVFVEDICAELLQTNTIKDEGIETFIYESAIYSIFSRLELDTEKQYNYENALLQIDISQATEYATIISGISEQVLKLIEKPARIYEQKEREYNESGIHRRNWNGRVSGNDRGIGSGKSQGNKELERTETVIGPGLSRGAGWNSISGDGNRPERGPGENPDGDIRIGSSKIPGSESSRKSPADENSGNLVQYDLRYRQSGNGDDGQAAEAIEGTTSGTHDGGFYGAGEIQHMDQGHSPGNRSKRSGSKTKVTVQTGESSDNDGSIFLPQKQQSLFDLIETQENEIESSKEEITKENKIADENLHKDIKGIEEQEKPETGIVKDGNNQAGYVAIIRDKINYRYDSSDNIGAGGQKTKYKANIDAIRLLKDIEKENRYATSYEQGILARYTGWGGLAQTFNTEAKGWENEYKELKELLSESEYSSARASTPNAHYTDPVVIRAVYKALERFDFKGGNIIEPALGSGLFYSLIPEEISAKSNLYGVELDSISGRIAKHLYQTVDIRIQGYEETDFSDNSFDVAIGNVPFGDYKLHDKRYNKLNLNIHDYFFAKTLDKVRPGGVIAFITTKGTLDKANSSFRKYLAERAELIGAIRLPNTAFKQIANTEVTTDIIFLQKREHPVVLENDPNWIGLGYTEDNVPVNQYYLDNPQMLLGKMVFFKKMYGNENDTGLVLIEGDNIEAGLNKAVENLNARIESIVTEKEESLEEYIPADPGVKNFTYVVKDQNLYYRENSRMVKVNLPEKTSERVTGLCELRAALRQAIDIQTEGCTFEELKPYQEDLLSIYNDFTKKYGAINSQANLRAFQKDADIPLVSSLELLDEKGNVKSLADVFYKQTIRPYEPITKVGTAADALAASLSERGRVDLDYMMAIFETDRDKIVEDLKGIIYLNPENKKYETADEYLSGDVRHKLMVALYYAKEDSAYKVNVSALESVQPVDLDASEIDVRLGTTWIEPEDIDQFIYEILKVPEFHKKDTNRSSAAGIFTTYNSFSSSWTIHNKSLQWDSMKATQEFGTKRADAYSIIEDTLNLRSIVVKDKYEDAEGKIKYIVNKNETIAARSKQDLLKEEFRDWIFKDPDRRKKYVDFYNTNFNNIRLREYDGSHLKFPGMSPEILLCDHQKNGVARILYGGNTLLAHVVGAGKTYTMQAACMEMRRLGLTKKAMFVLPNHLTEQQGSDFLKIYPGASILVATEKDFERANRKRFLARIATGDYDSILIGQSQFERIPMSNEFQRKQIERTIDEIVDFVHAVKQQNGDKWTVKQMEKMKFNLEAKLEQLADAPKDDVLTFEELGVDCIFVDEAHNYKNGGVFTKMRNVAGISGNSAKKVLDMQMKCDYIQSENNGRNVIFATGTPVSNSMTEMFIIQQFLQKPELIEKRIQHFDSWAANFGEVVSALELAPEGRGFRMRNRFSKFTNLPELMTMFKNIADIQTADMLNLPIPRLKNEKVTVVTSEPSEIQQELVRKSAERAERIRNGLVDPSVDNMLKITNEARQFGTDPRLIIPDAPDEPDSKINNLVENVYQKYNEFNSAKGTQIIFSDVGTPNDHGGFCAYYDIRDKLISMGIPENEICIIHDAKTKKQKENMFSAMRTGEKRIILGSTSKMGTGTNIQNKLVALHHLDCPWRPADIEQRDGRILRQGNENEEVEIFRYITKDTFDAYLFQIVEQKQRFISQVMTSKSISRSCEDIDEVVLNYAEIKALAMGDPRIKEKMDLDIEINKLSVLKAAWSKQRYSLQDSIVYSIPKNIRANEDKLEALKQDIGLRDNNRFPEDEFRIIFNNQIFTDKEKAGEYLLVLCSQAKKENWRDVEIGQYKGCSLTLNHSIFGSEFSLNLTGRYNYEVELKGNVLGNLTRIENALESIEQKLKQCDNQLVQFRQDLETAREEYEKPWRFEEEYKAKLARQAELNMELDLNKQDEVIGDESSAENEKEKGENEVSSQYSSDNCEEDEELEL